MPRHTFSAVFGAVIAQGMDYRQAFRYFKPDFDLETERSRRAAAGQAEDFGENDLYPDARPAMAELRAMGCLGRRRRQYGAELRVERQPA